MGRTRALLRSSRRAPPAARPTPPARSGSRPPSWLESYANGLALEATDPRGAASAYADVLAERPGAIWPRHRAAAVASRLGDHTGAADHLARCLARRPDSPTLLTQMANCLLLAGRTEAALEACDRAVARDSDYRDAYVTRGLVRAGWGRPRPRRPTSIASSPSRAAARPRLGKAGGPSTTPRLGGVPPSGSTLRGGRGPGLPRRRPGAGWPARSGHPRLRQGDRVRPRGLAIASPMRGPAAPGQAQRRDQ